MYGKKVAEYDNNSWGEQMPRISEFFGIAIYMYWFDTKHHKLPHFHALHGGRMAAFDLKGNALAGSLGKRADKLVKEWAQERRSELEKAWELAATGKEVPWIKPIN